MKVTATLLILLALLLPATSAQEHMQPNLPEDAIACFGNGYVREVLYSPDGARLAIVTSIGLSLHDTTTYQEVALLAGHTNSINRIVFSPEEGILASGSGDGTILLWKTTD